MLPLQTILCPTDFSDFSFQALKKGAELAYRFGAQLCVLHVMPELQNSPQATPFSDFAGIDPAVFEGDTRTGAKHALTAFIQRHHLDELRVRALVKRGGAADEIVSAAREVGADLIVLATHGLTGWRGQLFGSVAERVLRIAPCPVLIKRVDLGAKTDTGTIEKILCSTDWSEPSLAALEIAGEWASNYGAELCLLHVVAPIETPGLFLSKQQLETASQAEAMLQLEQILQKRLPHLAKGRALVRLGRPADQIAAAATEIGADLLVLATHGASGWRAAMSGTPLEHLLLGSVADDVLRLTNCPVLTVHEAPEPGARKSHGERELQQNKQFAESLDGI